MLLCFDRLTSLTKAQAELTGWLRLREGEGFGKSGLERIKEEAEKQFPHVHAAYGSYLTASFTLSKSRFRGVQTQARESYPKCTAARKKCKFCGEICRGKLFS